MSPSTNTIEREIARLEEPLVVLLPRIRAARRSQGGHWSITNPYYDPAAAARLSHPAPGRLARKMASGPRTAFARLRAIWFFGRAPNPPPLRRRMLLLLDPASFVCWPALRSSRVSSLGQRLARLCLRIFPPRPKHFPARTA